MATWPPPDGNWLAAEAKRKCQAAKRECPLPDWISPIMNRKGNKPVQQTAANICPFHPKTPASESYKSVSYMTIPQHSHARRQTSLLLVWLLGMLLPLYAQLQLQVQAPSHISANQQYFQVRYTIQSDDASNFREPATSDFELLAAPGVSTYSNTINVKGRVSSSSSTTYTLT